MRFRFKRFVQECEGQNLQPLASALSHHCSSSGPARVSEEIERTAEGLCLVVRPIDKHCSADDEIARDESPGATVETVIAIISHYEITATGVYLAGGILTGFGNLRGFAIDRVMKIRTSAHVLPLARVCDRARKVINVVKLAGLMGGVLDNLKRRFVAGALRHDDVLRQRLAVDIDLRAFHFYRVARHADDPLDVINLKGNVVFLAFALSVVSIAGILEDDNVASFDFALWQNRERRSGGKDELID